MLLKQKKLQKFYHKLGVSPKYIQYSTFNTRDYLQFLSTDDVVAKMCISIDQFFYHDFPAAKSAER